MDFVLEIEMTDKELLELAAKAAGMTLTLWQWTQPLGNDPYFATRRAIVRAAAEMGKEKS